jgi:hypothetical protein
MLSLQITEKAAYIRDLAGELAVMAEAENLVVLSYLLRLAEAEAKLAICDQPAIDADAPNLANC